MATNQKVIILQGIPASGKSTWAKSFCKNNKNYVRVNRDDLRNMRGEYWIPEQEGLITNFERCCIVSALQSGYNLVLDSTNLNQKTLKSLETLINMSKKDAETNIEIEYKIFKIPLEEAIRRDKLRENGVGEKVIRDFYSKYKDLVEWNLVEYTNKNLPKAIICDIDGTVAQMGDRSPYDYDRVDEDKPKTVIISLIKELSNSFKIIFLSGREDSCREKTLNWLEKHFGWEKDNITLLMRKSKDHRKDNIVKRELYQIISSSYDVHSVFDDRDSVVKMWRDLGLTCLQVDYGDF